MKKLLSVVLALALLVSLYGVFAASADEAPVKLTASLQLHSEDRYEEGLAFWTETAAKFGIELELITFNSDVANEKMSTMLASGDVPDLFWTNSNTANLYGADGMFEQLDPYIESMPNFAAMLDVEDLTPRRSSDGSLYYFPKYMSLYSSSEGTMTYRKDILEEMGETEPTTIEGWLELYRKVKETYPDLIVLMERSGNINPMRPVFGMGNISSNCGFVAQQGDSHEVVYLPTTENWKAMLEFYHTLYEEGILYEGYATVDYSLWWDQTMCTDKAFACNTQNFNRAFEATEAAHDNGYENVQWWVALNPENPITNTNEYLLAGSGWLDFGLALSVNCEAKDKAVEFIDWFYGDECMDIQIELTTQPGKPELPLFYWPIHMLNQYSISEEPIMKDHFTKNTPLVKLIPVVATTAEGAERMADETEGLGDYVEQMRDEFIMGVSSIEDDWDAYVDECKALGCDVAVEVVQGYVDAYYAAQGD